MFPRRVRNYDLPTSLSVLRTGTYTRLPAVIREGFSQPEKLDDETVFRTLAELDNVLRWRLACVERIPSKMSQYWIADGRAWFRVEGMWEASFTYGGGEAEETAEWYLLSLKFLFRVGDARGGELPGPTRCIEWQLTSFLLLLLRFSLVLDADGANEGAHYRALQSRACSSTAGSTSRTRRDCRRERCREGGRENRSATQGAGRAAGERVQFPT